MSNRHWTRTAFWLILFGLLFLGGGFLAGRGSAQAEIERLHAELVRRQALVSEPRVVFPGIGTPSDEGRRSNDLPEFWLFPPPDQSDPFDTFSDLPE